MSLEKADFLLLIVMDVLVHNGGPSSVPVIGSRRLGVGNGRLRIYVLISGLLAPGGECESLGGPCFQRICGY